MIGQRRGPRSRGRVRVMTDSKIDVDKVRVTVGGVDVGAPVSGTYLRRGLGIKSLETLAWAEACPPGDRREFTERVGDVSNTYVVDRRADLPFGLAVGTARKLSDINEELAAHDLVLVVSHWDGEGEREPTTLELMTPAEYERRCCASPAPALAPGVVILPDERGVSS